MIESKSTLPVPHENTHPPLTTNFPFPQDINQYKHYFEAKAHAQDLSHAAKTCRKSRQNREKADEKCQIQSCIECGAIIASIPAITFRRKYYATPTEPATKFSTHHFDQRRVELPCANTGQSC
ncbi:MAG: hypothetical protein V4582_22055 [Pseudomonadota bacterium]